MYAGRVACCSVASHIEYVNETDRQTDGRTSDGYITLYAMDAVSVITSCVCIWSTCLL